MTEPTPEERHAEALRRAREWAADPSSHPEITQALVELFHQLYGGAQPRPEQPPDAGAAADTDILQQYLHHAAPELRRQIEWLQAWRRRQAPGADSPPPPTDDGQV